MDENQLTGVLFVCHGNICRSAMAQCVMQQLVDENGWGPIFQIDSAATTREELGNPIYPPARKELEAHHVPIVTHRARQISRDEADEWDFIICMDEENMRHLRHILGACGMEKVHKLMEFTGSLQDVADPWYTRDFETTYNDVLSGCRAFLDSWAKNAGASADSCCGAFNPSGTGILGESSPCGSSLLPAHPKAARQGRSAIDPSA